MKRRHICHFFGGVDVIIVYSRKEVTQVTSTLESEILEWLSLIKSAVLNNDIAYRMTLMGVHDVVKANHATQCAYFATH